MKRRSLSILAAGITFLPFSLFASTVTISQNSNAATSNFQSPGSTATVGYTITTSDDGMNFYTTVSSSDPNALPFANFYFDTIASTPNTGSNLGFEFGATPANNDAFNPNTGTKYNLIGTGVYDVLTVLNGTTSILAVIPNSFFLNDPLGIGFATTPSGTLVSLHLSQSFGYSVVGGSANFAAPVELGDAIVGASATTPEPSSLVLLGTGILGLAGAARRRFAAR